jgi:hypothetical protein
MISLRAARTSASQQRWLSSQQQGQLNERFNGRLAVVPGFLGKSMAAKLRKAIGESPSFPEAVFWNLL